MFSLGCYNQLNVEGPRHPHPLRQKRLFFWFCHKTEAEGFQATPPGRAASEGAWNPDPVITAPSRQALWELPWAEDSPLASQERLSEEVMSSPSYR